MFWPKEMQEAKLFEYLVFYPFFATFKRNDSGVSSYTPQFLLRETGYNKDYFSDWPTGDAPFVIKYFENMASYINWWMKKDNKQSWKQIYLDNFVKFINTIDFSKDYKQLTFFNSGNENADLRNLYLPKGYEWLTSKPSSEKEVSITIIRNEETGTEFQVRDEDKDGNITKLFTISSRNAIYANMEIGNISGSTTIEGNLEVQSINGPDNGTVRIPAIEADKILLNGSEIIPGSNNIPSNLGVFNTSAGKMMKMRLLYIQQGMMEIDIQIFQILQVLKLLLILISLVKWATTL